MDRDWYILVLGLLGAMFIALMIEKALPHESHSGMQYDPWCCNGNSHTGDCQEIPPNRVTETSGGYQVFLDIGDHRLVTKPHSYSKPYINVRYSTDGQYHACLYPNEAVLRCLYVPPPAF